MCGKLLRLVEAGVTRKTVSIHVCRDGRKGVWALWHGRNVWRSAGNTGYQPRSDTKTPDKRAKRGEKLLLENERAAAWARERKAKQVAKKSK